MNLDQLAHEVRRWQDHNFPDRNLVEIAAKVCEEAGELVGATIKERQGIRSHEDHMAKAQDAVGDIVIALAGYCGTRGWPFELIVKQVWAEVRQRDWIADPENSHKPERKEPECAICPCGAGLTCNRCKWREGYSHTFLAWKGRL